LIRYLNDVGINLKLNNSRIISLDIIQIISEHKSVVGGAHGPYGEKRFFRHKIGIFCLRPNKKIGVVPITSPKKVGMVGRFFFFFLLFFYPIKSRVGRFHIIFFLILA
jgi:hypothetical protein